MRPRSSSTSTYLLHITIPEKISLTFKVRIKELNFALGPEGSKGIALLFLYQRRQIRVSVQPHTPAALPPGKTLATHSTGGWVGPAVGLLWRWKSLLTGTQPQTVQPVASRYIDWVIPAHKVTDSLIFQFRFIRCYSSNHNTPRYDALCYPRLARHWWINVYVTLFIFSLVLLPFTTC
jgi:hypothetical protein